MMRRLWIFVAGLILTAGGMAAQPSEPRSPLATSHVTGTMLVVSPQVTYTSARLRVTGPAGYEATTWSEGGDLVLDLVAESRIAASAGRPGGSVQALPDGRYRYEAIVYSPDGAQSHSGDFSVKGGAPGSIVEQAGRRDDSSAVAAASATGNEAEISAEGTITEDFVFIRDGGTDPDDGDGRTELVMGTDAIDDLDDPRDSWRIVNDQGAFSIAAGEININNEIKQFTIKIVESVPNSGVFDVPLVGIGTTQPVTDLHVFSGGSNTRLRLAAGSNQRDLVAFSDGGFEIQGSGGERAVRIFPNAPDNSLVLRTNGIGIGTDIPAAQLHVVDSGALPMRLTGDGHNFDFRVGSAGLHLADNAGQAVAQFNHSAPQNALVVNGAGVGIGTASPSARLHVAGTFRADGDVALHSSRTVKTGFAQVSPAEILARIADLPVASWRYKDEDESTRHIGPFAEDFQRLFGLGDGETISVIDAQGVALAAIQGLQQTLADKDAEIAQLNERLAIRDRELRERIERLERRIEPARESKEQR